MAEAVEQGERFPLESCFAQTLRFPSAVIGGFTATATEVEDAPVTAVPASVPGAQVPVEYKVTEELALTPPT